MRARFVAEILQDARARDPFREDDPPVPFEGATSPGGYAEVALSDGVAREIERVAEPGSALASLVRIAIEHGLDPVFPPAVRAEVEAIFETHPGAGPPGTDDPSLEDLTDVPFVTIDNDGSRDLDQALHVEAYGAGHRVRYALADASYYVRPGTALFAEALARGASFYLPGWMIPMLPRRLSEGLVSLNPGVLRRALVFDMRLDASGRCTATHIVRARIESRAKLTYPGVQGFLDAPDTHPMRSASYAESLRLLRVVGARRIALAIEREVVHHRRATVEVGLADARSFYLYSALRNDVERYNEQVSLLCNVEGAELVRGAHAEAHVQPIYRVHPPPPPERVDLFERLVTQLAALHGDPPERWRWRRDEGQSLALYLDALPHEGEGARIARAIQRQAILMNVRSSFSDVASEHHGVGAEVYARFSSPMREVVGVFLHKELVELLRGPPGAASPGAPDDELVREQVIEAANRSKRVQSKLTALGNRLALDQLFERDLLIDEPARPARRGTVMGLTGAKLYVSLDDPCVDVKLYRVDLERALEERLRPGDGELSLLDASGRAVVRVGEAIDLRVARRDEERDRWVLLPV